MIRSKSLQGVWNHLLFALFGAIGLTTAWQNFDANKTVFFLIVVYILGGTLGWLYLYRRESYPLILVYFTLQLFLHGCIHWNMASQPFIHEIEILALPVMIQIAVLRNIWRWVFWLSLALMSLWFHNVSDFTLLFNIILLSVFAVMGHIITREDDLLNQIHALADELNSKNKQLNAYITQLEELHHRDLRYYESLDRVKTQFIGTATHDLKNPLGIIVGYADLIQNAEDANPELQEYARGILRGTARMQTLITDILDLAQVETGVNLQLQDTPLNTFLADVVQHSTLFAKNKNLSLRFLPGESTTVRLDANRMVRVIDNLVSNAIKYTPSGGGVQVKTEKNEHYAIIRVIDNGIGIPAHTLPYIFESFYRVHEDATEGTGLGLTVVKAIVEQHDGRVEVESQHGNGSTFSVFLPLVTT